LLRNILDNYINDCLSKEEPKGVTTRRDTFGCSAVDTVDFVQIRILARLNSAANAAREFEGYPKVVSFNYWFGIARSLGYQDFVIIDSMKHTVTLYCSAVLLLASLQFSPSAKASDLNGRWNCDDGAIYVIQQSGNRLAWDGRGRGFHNKFQGVIMQSQDGPIVLGVWNDVEGSAVMYHGILSLFIVGENTLNRHYQEGNFGGSVWTRIATATSEIPFGGRQPGARSRAMMT
jgi:hypothetical protein